MDSQLLSQGGVGNSIDVTCHLSYKTAMDKGYLAGADGAPGSQVRNRKNGFP